MKLGEAYCGNDKNIMWDKVEEIKKKVNCHTSMWVKITGACKNWNQIDRVRETLINHSNMVPPMYLLLKDYKKIIEGELPSTRPVVSGCNGLNFNLNNLLSEVLEPISKMESVKWKQIW